MSRGTVRRPRPSQAEILTRIKVKEGVQRGRRVAETAVATAAATVLAAGCSQGHQTTGNTTPPAINRTTTAADSLPLLPRSLRSALSVSSDGLHGPLLPCISQRGAQYTRGFGLRDDMGVVSRQVPQTPRSQRLAPAEAARSFPQASPLNELYVTGDIDASSINVAAVGPDSSIVSLMYVRHTDDGWSVGGVISCQWIPKRPAVLSQAYTRLGRSHSASAQLAIRAGSLHLWKCTLMPHLSAPPST